MCHNRVLKFNFLPRNILFVHKVLLELSCPHKAQKHFSPHSTVRVQGQNTWLQFLVVFYGTLGYLCRSTSNVLFKDFCPFVPPSYGGHSHDHLLAGAAQVGRSQLAEDVQDGVATVVVENSPDVPAHSPAAGKVRLNLSSSFTAAADGVA